MTFVCLFVLKSSAKMHMEEAANLLSALQETLTDIDTVVTNVNEHCSRTILNIETAAQRLLQAIADHRHKLVSKVCEITEAKLHALQAEKDIVQENFRALEHVLRCAQNTGTVEDSTEWDNALSRHLHDLKELVFDFQDYDEEMEFHFLYRDENLLAAICNFGDVFTLANDGDSKIASPDVKAARLGKNITSLTEEEEKLDGKTEFQHTTDRVTLIQEFQENFKSPDHTTETQEADLKRTVLTKVFEETVDVVQLIEIKGESQELRCEDDLTSTLELVDGGISDSSARDITCNEIEQTTVLRQNWSDVFTPVEQLVFTNEEVEVSAFTVEETSSAELEKKDVNNNNKIVVDRSVVTLQEDSFSA